MTNLKLLKFVPYTGENILLIAQQYLYYLLSLKYLKSTFSASINSFRTNKTYFAQYGFPSEHSIEFVVLDLVDRIMMNMNSIKTYWNIS